MKAVDFHRACILAALLGSLLPARAGAVDIVECRGSNGKVFFSDRCPPGSAVLSEKKIRTGESGEFDLERLKSEHPVVMYLLDKGCDACDLMRNYLQKRSVPFTSKDVSAEHPDNQEELKEKIGQVTVPVVTVGEQVISGYNRAALASALDTAGYPDAQTQGDTAAAEAE